MNMKTTCLRSYAVAILLVAGSYLTTGLAQEPRPGGYAATPIDNKEVVAAAEFAVKAQHKAMQEKKPAEAPKLELVTILQAEQQVVAGMNFRLKLSVRLNGKVETAEAMVWWQAWRNPDPYQLTSWTWK
ncbi:MAG: hypothetical protein RI957_2271 [Verrucomicrobiota bacterium]|jgi:hypothetical protein